MCSSSIEAITGWSSEELIGRRIVEFVHDIDQENVERILSLACTRQSHTNNKAEAFQWTQSYAKKLKNVQHKFSQVLTDIADNASTLDSEASTTSTGILPETGEGASSSVVSAPQDSAEAEWSQAIMTHDKFAKVFSKNNCISSFGLDYAGMTRPRGKPTDVLDTREAGTENNVSLERQGDCEVDHRQVRLALLGASNSYANDLNEESAKLPQMLRYQPSHKLERGSAPTKNDMEENDSIKRNLKQSQAVNDSYEYSSLPSMSGTEGQDTLGSPCERRADSSFSFRMISKSGSTVYMEASCNPTPQGVVAVCKCFPLVFEECNFPPICVSVTCGYR